MTALIHRLLLLICGLPAGLFAITPGEVLLVFNGQNADSGEVAEYYQFARPGVLSLDLDDVSLEAGTISYADYISKIRTPIRDFLNDNGLESSVLVILLTKGIPHRIQDLNTDDPNVGDRPGAAVNAYNNGNGTYASVDSELTLLQFDLEENEAGGEMDSAADRAVYNPYFGSVAPFGTFDRSGIRSEDRRFYTDETNYGWWMGFSVEDLVFYVQKEDPLDAGHIYLTARLDGDSVADVKAMIDRARGVVIRRQTDAILLDESPRGSPYQVYSEPLSGESVDDYEEVAERLGLEWERLQRNTSSSFLTGEINSFSFSGTEVLVEGPVAHLNSYGTNHSGSGKRNYLFSYADQLVPGASFFSYESYGAAGLGGVSPPISQAQIAEWIASGGTFATGPVWEPFTFGISRSAIFLNAFFNEGLTYVEAAWSSIMQISWQSVVLGDPLATATVIDAEPYYEWTLAKTGTTPTVNESVSFDGDFDDDRVVNGAEYSLDLDPVQFTRNPIQVTGTSESGGAELGFFVPDTVPDGIDYRIERSETLEASSWSEIATWNRVDGAEGSAVVVADSVDGGVDLQITDTVPLAPGEGVFYRLSTAEGSE